MGAGRKKAIYVVQAAVWLGVVAGSVLIVLTQRETYGIGVYVVPAMAAAMLTIFVVVHLPGAKRRSRLPEMLSRASTLLLIVAAIVVLVYTAVVESMGLFGRLVLLFFAFTFTRILFDYVKHLWRTPLKGGADARDET